MGAENPSNDTPEVVPVDSGELIIGSRYDNSLHLDTTPVSRVDWITDGEGRSTFDAKLIIDTTPATRPEYIAPPDNVATPDSGTDGGSAASDQ
jgi:hypothetical protein